MKYGRTERISGIVILVALAIILLPWLMSEPEPRADRQQPSFIIERPIDVPRREVAAPEQPESIQLANEPAPVSSAAVEAPDDISGPEPVNAALPADSEDAGGETSGNDVMPTANSEGEWGVQIGSFGNAENVERLKVELEEQGFSVFTRERNEELTAVLVGPFETSAQGERAMALVKERVNYQGLLVRVRD
ncbi:MAG: SPOR domain-containing protein [Pseudomonadota bacterium]